MKPTYDEVVEKVARAICKANMVLPEEYTASGIIRWKLYAKQAKAAIRAMQDMMPEPEHYPAYDCNSYEYYPAYDCNSYKLYEHFKTMRRDNETN